MDKSLAGDSITPDSHLLRLSCRFIPYDQWLTTHVDPSWKVKQVKLWLLGKFLGVSLHNQNQPNADINKNASHSQSMSSGHRGVSIAPASPAPRYRPASPITFAPDPRTRPISPILFAKSSSKGKGKRRRKEASNAARDVGGDGDMHGDDDYGIDDNGVGGYEEDDEWDTADEGTNDVGNEPRGGSAIYPKRPQINTSSSWKTPVSASILQTPNVSASLPSPSASKYNTAISTYTLLRFSTGQKLEDEYQLSWYDLASHEILELHAHAPVQHLPASFGLPNPDLTTKSEHAQQHARTDSNASLSRQTSRIYAQASSSEGDTAHTFSLHTYFPVLNRTTPTAYVQPYWEGYVRALRVVWREESSFSSHQVYGGRGGGVGEAGTGGFVPALAAMGYDPAARDFRASEVRDAVFAAYGAGFADGSGGRGKGKSRTRSTRLEWRLRWAIVRDGMLYLSKDREDKAPAQAYPLSALTALRGADHLATSSYFSQYQHGNKPNAKHPQHQQRNEGGFPRNAPHHRRASSSVRGHRNAASMDSYYTNNRDSVSDLDSDSDGDKRTPGVRMSELESEDLKIICIKFKAGGKVRGPFVPPTTTEPRNPKKYSSTIGYGALLASSGENGSEGGVDAYGFGTTAYVTAGAGSSSPSQWLGSGDKGKGKKGKDKEKRGPYLRKSSLPSLGLAEGSRTLVNLLGREKEKEGAKLTKASPRGKERDKEKEKNKDWIYAFAGVGPKPSREKDKSFGMQLAIPGIKKKTKPVDKGKAKDISYPSPHAATSGFNHFDDVDEQEDIIEDPEAEHEDTVDNAAAGDGSDGESDEEDNAGGDTDADAEKDPDEDTEPGVRSDSPYLELRPPPTTQIAPRAHPLQTAVVSLDSDSEESLALSSPVFRRNTLSDAEDNESDGEKNGSAYRYGYRFNYNGVDNETRKGVPARSGRADDVKDPLSRDKSSQPKPKNVINPKVGEEPHRGDDEADFGAEAKEKAEWIVLDMGTDLAFSSLLRILHRQFPSPISSSFVSALPRFCAPTPASTPTPTPTPFPSPVSSRPAKPASGPFAWSVSPAPSDGEREDSPSDRATTTRETARSVSQQSSILPWTPQHPPALAALSKQAAFSMQKTFGALPYPEWRIELVERAQKAGMGDVGSALRWVMWQCNRQLVRDLEDVRSLKDEGASSVHVRKRRGTIGSRSSKKCRRGDPSTASSSADLDADAPMLSDSDGSEETGKLIVISDSEEESSEAEWQGWMADLFRQQKARAHAQRAKEAEDAAAQDNEGDRAEPPKTPADDRRLVLEKRKALEPSAIVSTSSNTPPSSTFLSTPSSTLRSPSSSESLAVRQRTRTLSFSPEVASGPSSSLGHGYSVSRSMSPLANPEFQKQPGQSLSHSASMYTGLRSVAVAEQSLRRPSMPTLSTEQTISISTTLQPSITRTPGSSSTYIFPQNPTARSQSPPQFISPFTGDVLSPSSTATTKTTSSNSSAVRGRASSTGLGSLGRSASIFGRSNGALRKDADKAREREEKGTKEREEKYGDQDKAKEGKVKAQRPKLLVTTPGLQHTVPEAERLSPQPVRKPKPSIMRHVRSGSSLKSSEEVEPLSPTAGGFGKKKKGVFGDRFVRGLG